MLQTRTPSFTTDYMASVEFTRAPSAPPRTEDVPVFWNWHRASLYFLYALTVAVLIALIAVGAGYYRLPLTERPHNPLHETLRPSGLIGHGIGIVGSAMMLLLLLYSVRKRTRFMQRAGNIRYWLNYHIWLGITGPLLVLFHTTFKFGGIVSISFWSMVAVALSGVVGRYIYLQIPRSLSGHELNARELEDLDRDLVRQMTEIHGVNENVLAAVQTASGTSDMGRSSGWSSMWNWMTHDVRLRSRLRKIHRSLTAARMAPRDVHLVLRLARQKAKLQRRMQFLGQAQKLLHHWHVFHKPFAIVMLVIMVVHVVVAVLFGYRWIWS